MAIVVQLEPSLSTAEAREAVLDKICKGQSWSAAQEATTEYESWIGSEVLVPALDKVLDAGQESVSLLQPI
jgi:hypothetical protein